MSEKEKSFQNNKISIWHCSWIFFPFFSFFFFIFILFVLCVRVCVCKSCWKFWHSNSLEGYLAGIRNQIRRSLIRRTVSRVCARLNSTISSESLSFSLLCFFRPTGQLESDTIEISQGNMQQAAHWSILKCIPKIRKNEKEKTERRETGFWTE